LRVTKFWNGLVPTKSQLGVSTCTWHDETPQQCKTDIAGLWGCTNGDPLVFRSVYYDYEGFFADVDEAENFLEGKGYHYTHFYVGGNSGEDGTDFTRGIDYGYRYQAQYIVEWEIIHFEGPEPNPEGNWHGLNNGWFSGCDPWSQNCPVSTWHTTC